tara:strand:+ start:1768 stop:3948 length:2181 start_codon:yes stop_codon:yes gene_type:complete
VEQTVKVNLDTREFDKGIKKMNSGFGGLASTIGAAVAALGSFQIGKSLLNTARDIENLEFQLRSLTGSTTEASRAMQILKEFASTVPFELGEIQRTAPALLSVAQNTEELNQILAITADIAAASGLSFQEAGLQLQRSFSAGIGAADLFREKGVKSMLGFQEGVQYTAKQTKDLIMNGFADSTIAIAGSAEKMATTFDGQISMIMDKFGLFQQAVMDAGPFEALKGAVTLVNQQLEAQFGSMKEAAEQIGKAIVQTTFDVLLFGAKVMDGLKPVFDFVGKSVAHLVNFAEGMPGYIKALGIIGFLMLGLKGKAVVLIVAGVFKPIMRMINELQAFTGRAAQALADFFSALGTTATARHFQKNADQIAKSVEEFNQKMRLTPDLSDSFEHGLNSNSIAFKGLGITMENATGEMGEYEKALRKNTAALDKQITKTKLLDETQKKIDAAKPKMEKAEQVDPKEVKAAAKAAEALKKRFTDLQQSLMSETQLEEFEFDKKLSLLNEYYVGRTQFDANYLKLREELESRHQKKMAAIAKSETQQQVDIFKSGQFQELKLGDMKKDQLIDFTKQTGMVVLNELGKQNKAAFQAAKAMNIAMAIMNTAAGVTNALATVPFPFNLVVAGIIGAAGAIQIATIASQSYQGRKTGGLVQGGTPYMVGENGPEMFMPSQTGTIIPNKNMGGGQNVNVNFTINTINAQGVDELLVSRRSTITNIIRDAAQQKGQRSPV